MDFCERWFDFLYIVKIMYACIIVKDQFCGIENAKPKCNVWYVSNLFQWNVNSDWSVYIIDCLRLIAFNIECEWVEL